MELKYIGEGNVKILGITFNRTLLELKFVNIFQAKTVAQTFNRTLLELKYAQERAQRKAERLF